jgi:hypothetical protein
MNTPSRQNSTLKIGSNGLAGQYGHGYQGRERNGSPRPVLQWLLLVLLLLAACLVLLLLVVACSGRYACRPAALVRRWMSSIDQIQYVDHMMNIRPAGTRQEQSKQWADAGDSEAKLSAQDKSKSAAATSGAAAGVVAQRQTLQDHSLPAFCWHTSTTVKRNADSRPSRNVCSGGSSRSSRLVEATAHTWHDVALVAAMIWVF